MFYYEKKKKLKLVTKVSLEIISDRGSIPRYSTHIEVYVLNNINRKQKV